jgi:hypothetical protein
MNFARPTLVSLKPCNSQRIAADGVAFETTKCLESKLAKPRRLEAFARPIPKPRAQKSSDRAAGLTHHALRQRRHPSCRDVGPVELRDKAAVARDAHTSAKIRLQIHVRRGRNERHDLPALINERELRRTWPLRDDWTQNANCIVPPIGRRPTSENTRDLLPARP